MSSLSRYRKIVRCWKSMQFEIVVFSLGVLGVWLIWKLSRRPFVPGWVIYVIIMWVFALLLHVWRIIYLIRKTKKD